MAKTITPRQREIVARLADGLTYREIARDLGISPATVRTHVQAVAASLPGPGGAQRRVLRYAAGAQTTEAACRPALTPGQWESERVTWENGPGRYAVGRYTDRQNGMVNVLFVEHPDGGKGAGSGVPRDRELGMAALCLHGHPQGFTRADVQFLRAERDHARSIHGEQIAEGFDFDNLAARIEALLPPEGA